MNTEISTSKSFENSTELSRPVSTNSTYSQKFLLEGKKAPENDFDSKNEIDKLNNEPKKKNNIKAFIAFFIKNFGIVILVIGYAAGGAFLFKILEQHEEIQNCQKGEGEWNKVRIEYRTRLFNYIYFNTTSNPWLPVDNATIAAGLYTAKDGPDKYDPLIKNWLVELRNKTLNITSEYKYKGQDCEKQSAWTYLSALLFTITILTTLGYGHVSPTTWEGQIVCICYSLLGIPLFVMSTVKVSSFLGDLFKFLYGNIFCYICIRSKKSKKEEQDDEKENEKNYEINDDIQKKETQVIDDDDDEENDNDKKDNVSVPLALVLLALAGYLIFGAWIFTLIEPTWNLREGTYFSFISLSTIGFGDYVPGIKLVLDGKEAEGGTNLIIASIYIYFGLAILGMCFQLMQDEVVEKIHLIMEKLGFSKKGEKKSKVEFITDNKLDESEKKLETDRTVIETPINIREATVISVKPKESSC
ncbi:unnamed protein product [Brachionus calyciflorus]|uniref:Potassium channel domain-containing protein n=1 Tax=Brachionus calyciflorus TaxID=104777 RepID=A0A813RWY7_9BILA|nr:unnamed protein product [Brachionus calyciflorus]